ncbi:MAG: hypothetical protein ACT4PW_05285 [Acidimicrobiia bacterium]
MIATFASAAQSETTETWIGGAPTDEVIMASAVALVAIAGMVGLGYLHRRKGFLQPVATLAERLTGLPAWCVIPVMFSAPSLLVAMWGLYWDVSWHIDLGRDQGPFANTSHWFIIAGLAGLAFSGVLAMILGDDRSPTSVRLTRNWAVPVGSVLVTACAVVALGAFPVDDIWHRLFGIDVTAWSPPHLVMIVGASLTTIGLWALVVEARRVAPGRLPVLGRLFSFLANVGFAGGLLVGLSTVQIEWDFGVGQFRQVFHPVLVMFAAGVALVAARIRLGRGGAIAAVGFYLVLRTGITVGVHGVGRSVPYFPLYAFEALLVELVALKVPRDRQITLGAVAGAAIGTIGFAGEWVWTHVWMPLPWDADMLPEVAVMALVAGVSGGILGGFLGRAFAPAGIGTQRVPKVAGLAWAAIVALIVVCLPISAKSGWSAELTFQEAGPGPNGERTAFVTALLSPLDAADKAVVFDVMAWQGATTGQRGGLSLTSFSRQDDGSWRSTGPVPISGPSKVLLRLATSATIQAAPVYASADPELGAAEFPSFDGERPFLSGKELMQPEARTDFLLLERLAYGAFALFAVLWLGVLSWMLRHLDPSTPFSRIPRPASRPVEISLVPNKPKEPDKPKEPEKSKEPVSV